MGGACQVLEPPQPMFSIANPKTPTNPTLFKTVTFNSRQVCAGSVCTEVASAASDAGLSRGASGRNNPLQAFSKTADLIVIRLQFAGARQVSLRHLVWPLMRVARWPC